MSSAFNPIATSITWPPNLRSLFHSLYWIRVANMQRLRVRLGLKSSTISYQATLIFCVECLFHIIFSHCLFLQSNLNVYVIFLKISLNICIKSVKKMSKLQLFNQVKIKWISSIDPLHEQERWWYLDNNRHGGKLYGKLRSWRAK